MELDAAGSPSTLAEHDWDDRSEMLVHVGTLVEEHDGAAASKAPTTRSGPSTAEPSPPPAVATGRAVGTSDVSSAASASSGSLPSAVLGTPRSSVSSSRTSTPLPPAASNGPDQLPADSPSGQSRILVPYAAYLPPNQGMEEADTAPRSHRAAREAVNADGGIVLDADREIMLKFLVGRTGDRHGKLPVMASLSRLFVQCTTTKLTSAFVLDKSRRLSRCRGSSPRSRLLRPQQRQQRACTTALAS